MSRIAQALMTGAACLGCGLALAGATGAPASAAVRPTTRTVVVAQVKPLSRLAAVRTRTVTREARGRNLRAARRAASAARRGDLCAVAGAVGLMDRVGTLRQPLARLTRTLRRAGVPARCRDAGRRGQAKGATQVEGGLPGSGVEKPHGAENDQGEDDVVPLPVGPDRPREGGRPPATEAEATPDPTASGARVPPVRALGASVTDPLGVFRSTAIGTPSTNLNPLDPSTASAGNVVLVSGNLYLAVSTDGGRTFTYKKPVDIYSTSDPASLKNPDGGACCDQVVHYDAATDRFYWLLQYWCTVQSDCKKRPGQNRLRLAVASPKDVAESGGTRWRFWDITSSDVGIPGQWLDFPDLAVGRRFLYLTVNSPSRKTAFWMRFRKTALRDGTLDWWYHRYDGEYTLKPVQGTHRVGFAVRRQSTTDLELKRWPETTTATFASTIPIGTTPTQACAATSPDGQDLLAFQGCGGPSSSVAGAALEGGSGGRDGHIWVGWTSGTREEGTKNKDGSDKLDGAKTFDQSHIELAVLDPITRKLVDQPAVWSPDHAFAYPYLAGGPSGEVVMTYMAGGGRQYPGWGACFLTNTRSCVRIANSTVGSTRVGDYLAVRPAWPSRTLWSATGNVLDGAGFAPRYALFGRRGDRPLVLPGASILQPGAPVGPAPVPPPAPVPVPVPALPDLVISDLTGRSVTVTNRGTAAAPALFFVVVRSGAAELARFDVQDPLLAAGASRTFSFDCVPGRTLTAVADADGQVAESDETDNTRTATFATCPQP